MSLRPKNPGQMDIPVSILDLSESVDPTTRNLSESTTLVFSTHASRKYTTARVGERGDQQEWVSAIRWTMRYDAQIKRDHFIRDDAEDRTYRILGIKGGERDRYIEVKTEDVAIGGS